MSINDTDEFSSCGWNSNMILKFLETCRSFWWTDVPCCLFLFREIFHLLFQGTWFSVDLSLFQGPLSLSLLLFLLSDPLSFFPSGAYFSLFCLSFSVSDTSAPASLNVQCDRWNMTGEKKKVSVLPVSGKVTCKYLNKKGKKVHFYVLNILHSKRHSTFRDCTGDSLNTVYSVVHPIKFVLNLSLGLCLYTHIYIIISANRGPYSKHVEVFPLFSKGFGSSN